MSAISISLTPGYQFTSGELLSNSKLNALGQPAISLLGQLSTQQIGAQAVTTPNIALNAITEALMANATFTPDGNGTAPFAAGWLSNLFVQQGAGPVTGRTNCLCTNTSGTPTTGVTTTADELVLKDGNDNYYRVTGVNVAALTTTNGAGGLDTGAVAASTWYYVYVISNGPTATAPTVQALISLGQPSPAVLPTGYTFYALVGAVYTNGTGQLTLFRAFNRRVYTPEVMIFTGQALTTAWAAQTTNPSAGVSGLPMIAKRVFGTVGVTGPGGCGVAGDTNGTGACYATGYAPVEALVLVGAISGVSIHQLAYTGTGPYTVTATCLTNHNLVNGAYVTITGATHTQYNVANVQVTVTSLTTFTYSVASSPGAGETGSAAVFACPLLAEATTTGGHGLVNGQTVNISGTTQAQYNGTFVVTVQSPTTFSYLMATAPGVTASGSPVMTVPLIDGWVGASYFDVPVETAQAVYVKASSTAAINQLVITGYEF